MSTKWIELIEPEALISEWGVHTLPTRVAMMTALSSAISLKRIADILERENIPAQTHYDRVTELLEANNSLVEQRRTAEAALIPMVGFTEARQAPAAAASAVGELALAAAVHKGQMILDVDTAVDGSQHAHAVAVWDDADDGGRTGD